MSWQIDFAHSQVEFNVRHMMIAKVRGQFNTFSGVINFDENDTAITTVDMTIDSASINTGNADRDAHLRSGDFFDAEQFPTLRFVSTRVEQDDAHHGRLIGDLTIKDVTREVVLDVDYLGTAKSPYGTTVAGFAASTKIDRKDWGLTWNVALETGGWLVSETININLDIELIKQPEVAPEAAAD